MAPLVFITGASSGIGQALADRYWKAGWRLALVARRGDALRTWAAARDAAPHRVSVHVVDVADTCAMAAAARRCVEIQGWPDVVIANAGISAGIDAAEFADLEVTRRTLETNVLGLAATFQPFVRAMCERRGGTLVGIASVAGVRGLPGHGAYCASKAAAISYCESVRGECRPFGVKVVTIAPGYIDTPLTRENRHPMPFLMPPEEFAEPAFRAIAAGRSWCVIPWQMALVARILRLLPNAAFDRLVAGQPRKHRVAARGEPPAA
jgi:short-subunit dehydrogenase